MEALAGTVELREKVEEVHNALEDARDKAQSLRMQSNDISQQRRHLRPQAREW